MLNDLAAQLRKHSLPISPISFLGVGGSGTLVKYRNLCGILTATHVMAKYLDAREIFSPVIATEDPTCFLNDRLGPTKDLLPSTFAGASGAGMWQVRLAGDDGIPKSIHELFFTGVLVAQSEEALLSRGPNSLYDIFLPYLNTFCT